MKKLKIMVPNDYKNYNENNTAAFSENLITVMNSIFLGSTSSLFLEIEENIIEYDYNGNNLEDYKNDEFDCGENGQSYEEEIVTYGNNSKNYKDGSASKNFCNQNELNISRASFKSITYARWRDAIQ